MRWHRVILVAASLGLAACTSPMGPRVPEPEDDRDKPPPSPGVAATASTRLDHVGA